MPVPLPPDEELRQTKAQLQRAKAELNWKTAFLEAQANSSIDGILVVDELGKKILQNQRMADLLKIPQPIADDKDDKKQLQWVADLTKTPGQFIDRVVYLSAHPKEISRDEIELKDGTMLDRYSSPVAGKDGKYYGRIWTFRDITERKNTEKILRVQSTALEAAANAIVITDHLGTIQSVNPAFTALTGYTAQEAIGQNPRILKSGKQDEAFFRDLWQTISSGQVWSGVLTNRRKDGNLYVEEMTITPLRTADGVIVRYIAIKQDITARKLVENALRDSKRFLQSTLNALSSHIAILDEHGTIVEVNAAWKRFASENIFLGRDQGVGDNYLKVCDSASGLGCEEAPLVAAGIRAVMAGQSDEFQLEYPCHSAWEKRWFIVRATRFGGASAVRVVVAHENITARRQAENRVRQSEERYRSLIDNARDAIFTISSDGMFTSLNPATETMGGFLRADWIGKPFAPMVHPDDLPLASEMFNRILTGKPAPVHELRGHPSLKRPALMEMTLAAQKDDSGKIIGVLGIGRDITERKRLEARLFQSQKMETVGKLAGGIAHEFNSILTAIIGQSELLLYDLPVGSPLAESAAEISKSAGRAATLTRQLLAYGRKQFLQPEILDLNRILTGMAGMVNHLMGGNVDMHIVPAPGLKAVKADAGQIEQVITNLAINARDAMPHGGKLTLETANVSFGPEGVDRYPELKPGDYVMLAITDTGTGMSAEVKARVFEPFFSTKGVGQGTGLGLSTCYGIIKQSGGHISIYSEMGRGTTFKIYLPQVESLAKPSVVRLDSRDLPSGTETILLVEDDPALREMAATLLRRLGYTVLAAANGLEALSLKPPRDSGGIDLLFTDVVMPYMSGKELSERVRALSPHTRILFTSAYTENAILHQGVLNHGVALLEKPFTPSELARKLRDVLDQPGPPRLAAA
ncbi:MAG: PAS domain S-box protein [Verrucomicrobiia bacterium]